MSDTFCFDKPITKIVFEKTEEEELREMVVYDIIESLFVPIYKLDMQLIDSLEWKITDHHPINVQDFLSYSIRSLTIGETFGQTTTFGQKTMILTDMKRAELVFEIDIPAEIENVIHFGGKGWLCVRAG